MTINQKKRFMESDFRRQFHEAVASQWFIEGVQAAFLEMADTLPAPVDQVAALSNFYRLDGARRFRDILLTLTESTLPKTIDKKSNLDHTI